PPRPVTRSVPRFLASLALLEAAGQREGGAGEDTGRNPDGAGEAAQKGPRAGRLKRLSLLLQGVDVGVVFEVLRQFKEIGSRVTPSSHFLEGQLRLTLLHDVDSPVKQGSAGPNLGLVWVNELALGVPGGVPVEFLLQQRQQKLIPPRRFR